ncbi:MAG: hypothetical protein RSA01_02040 [Clostridium sp.]
MKRLLSIFLIILFSFGLISCEGDDNSSGKDEKQQLEHRKKEVEEAESMMEKYLEFLARGEDEQGRGFLSKKALEKKPVSEKKSPKILGYNLKEIEHVGDAMEADVDIIEASIEKPYYAIINMIYSIKNENGKIVIDNIRERSEIAFYLDAQANNPGFYVREGRSTNKDPVVSLTEIPNFLLVESSIQPQHKVEIDRTSLHSAAISGEGKHMLFASNIPSGNVLIIAEKLFQINSTLTSDAEGSGGAGIRKESESSSIGIDAIDYFEGGTVEYNMVSNTGETISCKVNSKDKSSFYIYSSYSKELICKKIMEKFNGPEYIVLDGYYTGNDNLVLRVKNKKSNKEESYEIQTIKEKVKRLN